MNTPIFDFIKSYKESQTQRLHMPGHKGKSILGFEQYDITEIKGADSLYEADGIIKQSEDNASCLFGCPTFYSTEGSSLAIRAMLFLAKKQGVKKILAGRNSHKTFINTCALLDLEVSWLYSASYLTLEIDCARLEETVRSEKPDALFITSPDYLGTVADIKAISKICKKYNVLLLVDCAHGAYLKFLPESTYPTDLGADMCCASAHKTLPCLTGGAYLNIKDVNVSKEAKSALSVFGSTSPSYLILASLDKVNEYIYNGYKEKLNDFIGKTEHLKKVLRGAGYTLFGDEALKITICTKSYGYTGEEFGNLLREKGIEPEFCDPDFTVLMLSIDSNLEKIKEALLSVKPIAPITVFPPILKKCEKALSFKDAIFSESEEIDVKKSIGRVLSEISVGCPPAVPIIMCGETINENTVNCFNYYGITKCSVIKR